MFAVAIKSACLIDVHLNCIKVRARHAKTKVNHKVYEIHVSVAQH